MKIQLKEIDKRIIERVCKITQERTGIDDDDYIEVDALLAILDSLEDCYKDLEIGFDEYKTNVEENFKPCDVNDNWNYYATTIKKLDKECNKQYQFIVKRGLKEEYEKYNCEEE